MTEEIKILLDILNKVKDYDDKRYFISCGENDYLLANDEIKCLLNYITNLQKEKDDYKQRNENLKQELEKYKNIVDEAIKYNKELCKLYDCGMELSNAETNLVILESKKYESERKERGK